MVTYSIRRRAGLFYFRSCVPISLRNRFAHREIIRSLPVRTKKEADRVAQVLSRQCGVVFMVASLNPELGIAETNILLKRYLDGRAAADEAAILNLDGTRSPTLDDCSTHAPFIARQRATALAIHQAVKRGETEPFADLAKAELVKLSGRWSPGEVQLLAPALADMAALSCKNLARQAAAAHPDAPKLQSLRIERSTLDPRILRIIGRMTAGDRYGDVLSDDQIREFLASGRSGKTPDGEAILVTETEIRAFASQRPHDTIIPVPAADYFADHQQTAQGYNGLVSAARSSSLVETGRAKECDQALIQTPETCGPAALTEADFATQTSPRLAADADKTISQVWDAYSEAMVTDGRWKEDQGQQSKATLHLIIRVVGDVKVSALGPAKCNEIKREFLRLPSNYAKNPKWAAIAKGGGLVAVANAFQAEVSQGNALDQPVAIKTWNRHAGVLNGFISWAWNAVLDQRSEAKPIKLFIKDKPSIKKNNPSEKIFSPEHVRTLFSSEHFANVKMDQHGRPVQPSRYFAPFMLALTGARREEILQLRVKHIESVEVAGKNGLPRKIWFINLRDDDALKLKTETSRRIIPLHDQLLRLGFIEHLVVGRHGNDLLFNDVKETAKTKGDAFGKWALRVHEQLGLPNRGNHKWRHTVITNLSRSGVPIGHREQLVGHDGASRDELNAEWHTLHQRSRRSGRSEQATYDAGLEISELKDVVDKIEYDFDFSQLPTWRPLVEPDGVVVSDDH